MAGTIILFVALAGIGCWILIQLADARDWRAHVERMEHLKALNEINEGD